MISRLVLICIPILMLVLNTGYAQNSKKRKLHRNGLVVHYQIDKETKKTHGSYFKIDAKSKDTLIAGSYEYGIKKGPWRLLDKSSGVNILYDFTADSILYKQFPSSMDSSLVLIDNAYKLIKVDSPTQFLGNRLELLHPLMLGPFRVDFNSMNRPGKEVVVLLIDENGEIESVTVVNSSILQLKRMVESALEPFKDSWIPAIYNGKAVKSGVVITCEIFHNPSAHIPRKEKPYLFDIELIIR